MKKYILNKSFNLWFTGLPSSGKTTTALELKKIFDNSNFQLVHLDGDVVRKGLSSDLMFSKEDREENIRRIMHVSEIIVSSGIPVLTTFISPHTEVRQNARELIPNYIEVYVSTPLNECINRDVKGLYKKAQAGEIKNMTGLDSVYEAPEEAEIILETVTNSVEDNMEILLNYLIEGGYISNV